MRTATGRVSAIVGAHLLLPKSLSDTRVREARMRLRQDQRVRAVASAIGVSEQRLERLLADVTGLTPERTSVSFASAKRSHSTTVTLDGIRP